MSTRSLPAAVLAAAAALALAGCGGGASASPTPREADVQACAALDNYGPNILYYLQHPGLSDSMLAREAQELQDAIKVDGKYSPQLAPRAVLVSSEALLITTELDPAVPQSIPLEDPAKFADYQEGMKKACKAVGVRGAVTAGP